jgi:hypothetical protein
MRYSCWTKVQSNILTDPHLGRSTPQPFPEYVVVQLLADHHTAAYRNAARNRSLPVTLARMLATTQHWECTLCPWVPKQTIYKPFELDLAKLVGK